MHRLTTINNTGKYLWFVLPVFVIGISVCLFASTSFGGNKMEPLYNINEAKHLEPQVYDIKTNSSLSLFPVPQDNSIGTNDLNNAITLLSFPKGKITTDQYFKNAYEQVGGGGEYIPIVSRDTIGFGQTRRFVLYNFRTKQHERYRIAASLEDTIEKIAIADARQRHFIFEIQAHNPRSEDPWDYSTHLLLMDLSEKEARLVRQLPREDGVTWSVVTDKVFLYDREKELLQVFTMNFEPSNHPLADVIKQNKGKIRFMWIHAHQYLPFAILSGGRNGAMFITWSVASGTPRLLFSEAKQFSFSPDGKWVVFREESSSPAKTYLMPISEKYPNYLGSPILVSNNYFNPNNFGWTTNPVSFIGSSLNKLYRWDLENRDFPEKGKMSFHDYIVQKDLEKLAREKKQGLGNNH